MGDHNLLLKLDNCSPKAEVKEEEEEEKAEIKLETNSDLDDKLDVSKSLILDLVGVKSELHNLVTSFKKDITMKDDIVKKEYFSDDDIDTDSKELVEFGSLSTEEGYLIDPLATQSHEEDHIVASIANRKINTSNRKSQFKQRTNKKYIKERKFECHHCGKKFTQSDVLRRHIRIHTGERPHFCNFCNKTFRTKSLLKNHQQLHTGKRFKCDDCNKEFQQRHQLKCHSLTHTGNKPVFTCHVCKMNFSSTSGLQRHFNQIHLGLVRKQSTPQQRNRGRPQSCVQCNECSKEISSKQNLIIHWKRCHDTTNSASFICANCNKSFTEKHLLRFHITVSHMDSKPMICQYCTNPFKNSYYLKIHIQNHHHDDKSTRYTCDICPMVFRKVTYLKRHRQTHTNEDKTHTCDTCGQRCRSKSDIRFHVMTHIKGAPKPFKCKKCDMAFFRARSLKRHQLVHSSNKPYHCKHCDKAYKDSSSLKTHEKTVHFNASFTCATCGFHSINDSSFKRHLRQKLCSKKVLKKLK